MMPLAIDEKAVRRRGQVLALNAALVPNTVAAVAAWLHANWAANSAASSVGTIRQGWSSGGAPRMRSKRGHAQRSGPNPSRRNSDAVSDRRRHARVGRARFMLAPHRTATATIRSVIRRSATHHGRSYAK